MRYFWGPFAGRRLFGSLLIQFDVEGDQDVGWVTEDVLSFFMIAAALAGDSLYSQRSWLSSILAWAVLTSESTLHTCTRTCGTEPIHRVAITQLPGKVDPGICYLTPFKSILYHKRTSFSCPETTVAEVIKEFFTQY